LTAIRKLFDASLEYYGKVTPEMKKMMDSYKIIVGEAEKLEKIGGLHIANETDIELIKTAAEETENYYMKMLNIMNGFDVMATKPKTFFEEMTEAAKGFGEFWEKNGEAITMTIESIGEAVSAQFDNQITELENLQDANDKYYDKLIAAREGDEAAQAQLEQKKLEKAAEIQEKLIAERRKKAIFDKAQALVDIAINTAVGISAALASIPPNPILAAAIGVTGAIQAGIVASQPLPQYKTGLDSAKEDHIGIVADAGPELVHYPDGSSALFSKPTATFIPKFTSVDTASETRAKLKSLEFQNNMYKFTANNEKQVKLLSTIAHNTATRGMKEQDIQFIKRYAK
jgi:multimeric flavodoxin WrbA